MGAPLQNEDAPFAAIEKPPLPHFVKPLCTRLGNKLPPNLTLATFLSTLVSQEHNTFVPAHSHCHLCGISTFTTLGQTHVGFKRGNTHHNSGPLTCLRNGQRLDAGFGAYMLTLFASRISRLRRAQYPLCHIYLGA